jgi:hypothetical protein
MSHDEVDIAVNWAKIEGWNPGLYDADSFYQADPEGFLIGLLDNQPIATISAVRYGSTFGFLGFYIVKNGYRGQGYGIKIWNRALAHLSGRNIGLDGVVSQQSNYQKSGFQFAYRNIRYQGISQDLATHPDVIDFSSLPFRMINNYDRHFFPEDRTSFLKSWISQPRNRVMGIVKQGNILGYGMIRPCESGYKIGPLFADNYEIGESIFLALQSSIPVEETFYLDIPEINPFARKLVRQYNLQMVFETARMYNQTVPDLPMEKIFGVTSFELG